MAITAFPQVANNAQSTLAEDLTDAETDITVADGSSFPTPGNGFYATIWDADTYADPALDNDMEVVRVTARSGDTLTVTRGQRGTTGVAHLTGAAIRLLNDAELISDLQDAVNTVEERTSDAKLWRVFEEFVGGAVVPNGWVADGTVTKDTTLGTSAHPGVVQLAAANASGSAALRYGAPCIHIGGGELYDEWLIYIPTLSTAAEEYALRVGFGDTDSTDQANGVYFEYDRTATTNWRICAADNSTRTRTDCGTAVAAAAWIKLRIEVNAAGTSAEFFINGSAVGTVSTNIPTTAGRVVAPIVMIRRSASSGSQTRTVSVDYADIGQTLTTAR